MNGLKKNQLLIYAVLMTWIQTYLVHRFYFKLPINNFLEEILVLINSLGIILLFYGFTFLIKEKRRVGFMIFISLIFSIWMISNTLFYKFYSDVMTLPVLLQKENTGGLGSSILNLLDLRIILLMLNIPILWLVIKKQKVSLRVSHPSRFIRSYVIVMLLSVSLTTVMGIYQSSFELKYTQNRESLVKKLGIYQYGLYDAYLTLTSQIDYVLAESDELVEIQNYLMNHPARQNDQLFGIAKNQNIIIISLESLQQFAIGLEVNSEEVTPFLNEFIKECYYFDNFYQQTGQGKTSDAEFITENSLYAADRGSAFFAKSGNVYESLADILKGEGYYTASFHANEKEFWNRDEMYPSLGIDHFYDESSFTVIEDNSFGWGLNDEAFLVQTSDILTTLPQPFYAKILTLSNHYPFEIPEESQFIAPATTEEDIVNHYITTVRYLDEALKKFIQELKSSGLYDQSVILMYGDHYGIAESYYDGLAQLLNKEEISLYDHLMLQRVPFIVHLPGQVKGEIESEVAGQIDVKPTVLNLVGLEATDYLNFGTDLFSSNHRQLAILRDGSFITEDYLYSKQTCINAKTQEMTNLAECEAYELIAGTELSYSDLIINLDLLRFR